MKRDVRVRLDYVVTIDDPGDGIPHVKDLHDFILKGLQTIVTSGYIHPGGKFAFSLTRESMKQIRAARKTKR